MGILPMRRGMTGKSERGADALGRRFRANEGFPGIGGQREVHGQDAHANGFRLELSLHAHGTKAISGEFTSAQTASSIRSRQSAWIQVVGAGPS
jgi:hypothetical protein